MNKIKEFGLYVLAGVMAVGVVIASVSVVCLAVLMILSAVILIPLKLYGIYVLVLLVTGNAALGALSWWQGVALISLIIPFKLIVKEKK